MNQTKIIILLVWFLDILSIGIFIPTLPELALYFQVSAHTISYAIVLYALFSFIAAPILGQLSDIYGRKKILLICIIGTFLSSLMMSLTSIFVLFLIARIINGFTGWNISILQSMFSDISKNKEERMNNLWMIGALIWMWFIIWPIVWSLLLPLSIKAPFWFMTALAFFESIIVFLFLKETNKNLVTKKINLNPFGSIIKYLQKPWVNILILSFFILILSFSMFQGMFPVFLYQEYGLSGQYSGYIMSGVWVIIAVNQMFLLKRFWLKYFKLKYLFLLINIAIFILFCILSMLNYLPVFLVVFYVMVLFTWLVSPIYSSEIVESTHEHDRWEIMWVLSSLQSVTMFIWPMIAGVLIDKNFSIFLWWALIMVINILLLWKIFKLLK